MSGSNKQERIISCGPFGEAVARYLRKGRPKMDEVRLSDLLASSKPQSFRGISVLTSGQPVPSICRLLDEASHELNQPFLPIISDSDTVYVGPLVCPGTGSCWSCWISRCGQRVSWSDRHMRLREYYNDTTVSGPRGYLEPFAVICAARAAQILNALETGSAAGGYLWEMNMITRKAGSSTVIGVHSCPRCGTRRSQPTRSVDAMREELSYLMEGTPKLRSL